MFSILNSFPAFDNIFPSIYKVFYCFHIKYTGYNRVYDLLYMSKHGFFKRKEYIFMNLIKNISKSEVHVLKDQVSYQEGHVVSKTLAQNDAVSITLFAFDKDEAISTHESGGAALVTC